MTPFNPLRPYNSLPELPPKAELETHVVLKSCLTARVALEGLKTAGALIPNQNVLINSIPLREARDSSAIENIVTTEDKLFHHAAAQEGEADPATKETLRYRTALFEGFVDIQTRPLSTATAVKICRTIRAVEIDIRNTPGTALRSTVSREIIFTPPEGEHLLREKLGNWERYLNGKDGTDPLIRMAVGHYQFEAIHPFTDGNGRTGRALNILYLIDQGLLDIPVLYLSRFIIENKDDYYRLIREVTENGAWESWILYMLAAIDDTAKWTKAKIIAIKALMDHTRDYISAVYPKIYSRELVELIFMQPYCRIGHLIDAKIAQRNAASRYLKALSDIGVLSEMQIGREKFFVHRKFLKLLMAEVNKFMLYGPRLSDEPGPN
ncbi:MAG: Fic/DOC family N-terminal domain-containing protein [Rhodospirillales bacterium]|jgi:Fic family protein|nr:Fic/DOC family N-terminal domain-containing protein [Rhodospirillales bacterium]|tara:strand:- start:514 stop:1653 length:1140 start_codon:yes stop_codon:yes gene_type:complete